MLSEEVRYCMLMRNVQTLQLVKIFWVGECDNRKRHRGSLKNIQNQWQSEKV